MNVEVEFGAVATDGWVSADDGSASGTPEPWLAEDDLAVIDLLGQWEIVAHPFDSWWLSAIADPESPLAVRADVDLRQAYELYISAIAECEGDAPSMPMFDVLRSHASYGIDSALFRSEHGFGIVRSLRGDNVSNADLVSNALAPQTECVQSIRDRIYSTAADLIRERRHGELDVLAPTPPEIEHAKVAGLNRDSEWQACMDAAGMPFRGWPHIRNYLLAVAEHYPEDALAAEVSIASQDWNCLDHMHSRERALSDQANFLRRN